MAVGNLESHDCENSKEKQVRVGRFRGILVSVSNTQDKTQGIKTKCVSE